MKSIVKALPASDLLYLSLQSLLLVSSPNGKKLVYASLRSISHEGASAKAKLWNEYKISRGSGREGELREIERSEKAPNLHAHEPITPKPKGSIVAEQCR